jgi:hypothetical protein
MRDYSRREVVIGAAAAAIAAAVPVSLPAEAAALPLAPAPLPAAPRSLFEGRGLIGFEPPHPWGSWAWMNAIEEEAIWTPTEDLLAGLCPCVLCSIERDGS